MVSISRERLIALPFALPAVCIFFTGLLGLWAAAMPTLALRRFTILGGGLLVFSLCATLARGAARFRVAVILILLGGLAATLLSLVVTDWRAGELAGSLPALSRLASRFPQLYAPPGTGVPNAAEGANPRMVAGSMALFVPLAFSLAFFSSGRQMRLLGALSLVVLLLPLLLSQSPQGLLALAFGLGLVLAFRFPWSLPLQGLFALTAMLTWSSWHWGLPAHLISRLQQGIAARLAIWPAALLMLRDMPFTGSGLNSFPAVFPLYSTSLEMPPHAHNLFLQTALDTGVFGLAALLVLFATAFSVAWQAYRSSGDPFERAAIGGLAGGLAAFIGYGLWDSMTLGNLPAIAVWAMLGLLVASARLPTSHSTVASRQWRNIWTRRWLLVVLILVVSPLWLSALMVNLGRLSLNQSLLARQSIPYELRTAVFGFPAAKLASSAIRLNPSNSRAYVLMGLGANLRGDSFAAIPALKRASALDPVDSRTALDLGNLYYDLGDHASAVDLWRAAGYAPTLLQFSADANVTRDYAQASAWAALAVQVDPSISQSWLRLGRAQNAQDCTEQALATFTSAVERFPELSATYEELASLLIQSKDYDRAREVLAEGLSRAQPAGAQLYYIRSRLASKEGDYISAERDTQQALALSPSTGAYLAWLGDIYMEQGFEDKALEQYWSAIKLGSPDWLWRARQRIGALYARQGRKTEAVNEYQIALQTSLEQAAPALTLAQNYYALGDALAQVGQTEAAQLAYQQALQLDPHNEQARLNLGSLAVP